MIASSHVVAACIVIAMSTVDIAEPAPVAPVTRPTEVDLKGISFNAELVESAVDFGMPVRVNVRLKNLSERPLIFPDRRGGDDELNYVLSVHGPGNQDPALTALGRSLYSPKEWEQIRELQIRLAPGESRLVSLDVTKIFDMRAPGDYRIEIKRYVYQGERDMLIPINTNVVTVKIRRPNP
jgi:hypothetical protein